MGTSSVKGERLMTRTANKSMMGMMCMRGMCMMMRAVKSLLADSIPA